MTEVLCILLSLANILLILYIIFSFVPRPPDPVVALASGVRRLVDPALAPLRRVLPPMAVGRVGIDLSVIVVFLVISILRGVLDCGLLR